MATNLFPSRHDVFAVIERTLNGARKATKYLSPNLVVKASRRHAPRRGERNVEIVVTVGRPNYDERYTIALAKKAGEKFPIRKVQLKYWNKPKPSRLRGR